MLKKLLILTLAVGLLFGSQLPAQAALQEYDEAIIAPGQNQEKYIHNSLESMMLGATAFIVGHNEVNNSFETVSEVKRERGLVGDMGYAIALMYENKPADTQTFVADALNSAGIVTPAQAQGLGFASLSPLLNTWKVFRNIAYLFFVVVFLIIGFLIMLRQKINGQTVVTAQQAIPRVIIALLLVTFSYAIAGLLIDLMYLTMYFLLAIFGHANADGQKLFLDHNFFSVGFQMGKGGWNASQNIVESISETMRNTYSSWTGEAITNVVDFAGGPILGIVIAFTIAFKIFKLFFELLRTYISIILSVAFAPIFLMIGAIPGKNTFGEWLKSLIGNLSAFPIVLLILLVFDMLTGGITNTPVNSDGGGFMPPYLLGESLSATGLAPFIVGLGMILIIDELVKKGKEAMGAKPGIFDQFAGNVGGALKKGVSGGELVPGLAITDTNKLPYAGKFIGNPVSMGKTAVTTGATVAGAVGGGLLGGARRIGSRVTNIGQRGPGVLGGAAKGAGWANRNSAKAVGHTEAWDQFRPNKKKTPKK